MADSDTTSTRPASFPTSETGSVPDRLDRPHAGGRPAPHANFAAKQAENGRPAADAGPAAAPEDQLPPKFQARLQRLMADLEALEVVEEPDYYQPAPGELLELPSDLALHDPLEIRESLESGATTAEELRDDATLESDTRQPADEHDQSQQATEPQSLWTLPADETIAADRSEVDDAADRNTNVSKSRAQNQGGDSVPAGQESVAGGEAGTSTNLTAVEEVATEASTALRAPSEQPAAMIAADSADTLAFAPSDSPLPAAHASPDLKPVLTHAGIAAEDVSQSFSQQAKEILDILKRRQEVLSYKKSELEMREAALEKQMRQERLALIERQRLFEARLLEAHTTASSKVETTAKATTAKATATQDRHSENEAAVVNTPSQRASQQKPAARSAVASPSAVSPASVEVSTVAEPPAGMAPKVATDNTNSTAESTSLAHGPDIREPKTSSRLWSLDSIARFARGLSFGQTPTSTTSPSLSSGPVTESVMADRTKGPANTTETNTTMAGAPTAPATESDPAIPNSAVDLPTAQGSSDRHFESAEGAVEYRLPPHRTVERFLGFSTHKQPENDVAQHLPEESDANQDPSFYTVIEEYVQRQARSDRGLAVPTPAAIASVADALDSDALDSDALEADTLEATPASPSLRQQAEQLRSQHQIAIRHLQQTRRQLELLKQIIVQQQSHWAQAADALAGEREQWQTDRVQQQADWEHQRDEWQRLHTLEQNESTKRETFLDHREIAIRQLEERLQQAQVEILRDRVVLKQLERTARQSLSNLDWNQRWKVISEETQSYLRKVQDEAAQLQSETQRQMERLESRKAELLLYRESLRAWLERQMKLLARRTAHTNDRENQVQQAWDELEVTRQGVLHQHERLDQMLSHGLRNIDARVANDPLAPPRADAA